MVLAKEQMDQQNRRESPDIDPHKYSQLISDKGAKAKQWSKDSLFNKWRWNNWTSTYKKVNIGIDFSQKLTQNVSQGLP